MGAEVTRLENGGALVDQGGQIGFSPGTTTRQAEHALSHSGIQRQGSCSYELFAYFNGRFLREWRMASAGPGRRTLRVWPRRSRHSEGPLRQPKRLEFASLPSWRRATASLFGFGNIPQRGVSDRIQVYPAGTFSKLPYGVLPTSLLLRSISLNGVIHPFSSTFSTDLSVESFSWFADIPAYSAGQHNSAVAASDFTYILLPSDLPERIRQLAMGVTAGHSTPYAKAKALERYLKTNYTYRFADPSRANSPPPGRDPMDWFLFDHREGTCGMFSSAFVVLARSIGIPARVVSGWGYRGKW